MLPAWSFAASISVGGGLGTKVVTTSDRKDLYDGQHYSVALATGGQSTQLMLRYTLADYPANYDTIDPAQDSFSQIDLGLRFLLTPKGSAIFEVSPSYLKSSNFGQGYGVNVGGIFRTQLGKTSWLFLQGTYSMHWCQSGPTRYAIYGFSPIAGLEMSF